MLAYKKKIGVKRFNVLVDNNEHKLCLQFDTFGDRTIKTPDIPMFPFYKHHSWLKEFNGKFFKPTSITKEMIEFELGDVIINFEIINKKPVNILDDKYYTKRELSEIFNCSYTHLINRLKEFKDIVIYKTNKTNMPIAYISGSDINAALELKPDLFKKNK